MGGPTSQLAPDHPVLQLPVGRKGWDERERGYMSVGQREEMAAPMTLQAQRRWERGLGHNMPVQIRSKWMKHQRGGPSARARGAAVATAFIAPEDEDI